jgi:hypothetical protein
MLRGVLDHPSQRGGLACRLRQHVDKWIGYSRPEAIMPDRNGSPDNDRTEFDRIVIRLRVSGRRGARRRTWSEPASSPRLQVSNRVFCLRCLLVIFPVSLVIGGWLGILAIIFALVVTLRLVLEDAA